MLTSLSIKNVVLIDHLHIEFRDGLCALTGETGAGKSILLDSLGLGLGARADSGLVRKGTEQASVVAAFFVPENHQALQIMKDQDLDTDQNLILRRVVGADGRSKAYVNDQPISAGLMKTLGDSLVEIHGQFDTQSLLNPKMHRGLLDDYAQNQKALLAMRETWQSWKTKMVELDEAREAMNRAREDEEFLRSALEDLDELSPQKGEEEKLSRLRERLMKREQYLDSLQTAANAIEDIETIMGQGWRALERLGDDASALSSGMDRANAELQEVLSGITEMSADLQESEYSLSEIDDRLFTLKNQARKHACTIDELPEKRDELAAQLSLIDNQDDALDELVQVCEVARKAYVEKAKIVSDVRHKKAEKLDKLVAKELPPLKMDKARFEVYVEALPEAEWGENGMERVSFLVATNPNSPAGPLNKIASGGEMSRFMLALKVVMAEVGSAQTLIFDEVDSGIGGATADAVGERLAALANKRQTLVVTHSPQVAARANHHWIVSKDGGAKDVRTSVIPLPDMVKREEEIARMLSGAAITVEARAAAQKLLEGRAA